jgi:hypothetical protein
MTSNDASQLTSPGRTRERNGTTVAGEEHQKVVTEGQLKWAQFHSKRRAQEVRQKVEELWQTPASVSDVEGALSDDGNTTEESLCVVEENEESQRQPRRKKRPNKNNKDGGKESRKPAISRGRRAMLRVSKRAFEKRHEEVRKYGFRCGGDEGSSDMEDSNDGDEELAAKFADENAWKKARRKRRQSRRRKAQSTDEERLRRFENAFRAMMMTLAASQPQEVDIATPTKIWTRPENAPALESIDGRQYVDLKWGVSASKNGKIGQHLTTTDFAAMPVDPKASWLVHIPSKPTLQESGHFGPHLPRTADGQILIPENNNNETGEKHLPVPLGHDKFNEIVDLLQHQAESAQREQHEQMENLRQRSTGTRWQVQAPSGYGDSQVYPGKQDYDDEEDYLLEEEEDDLDPDSIKSIAAQYLTEFMANADEEHLIAALGEKYRDNMETLVEAASDHGNNSSGVETKDIVRRYMQGLQESEAKDDEKGNDKTGDDAEDIGDEDRKSLHRDQMASFAGIAARYLAAVSRPRRVARTVNTSGEIQSAIVMEMKSFLEGLNDDDETEASKENRLATISKKDLANQRKFEATVAQYLLANGFVDCDNSSTIISELQKKEGKEFSRLVMAYLVDVQKSAALLKEERESSKGKDRSGKASRGSIVNRYMQTIAKENQDENIPTLADVIAAPTEEDYDQKTFEKIAVDFLVQSSDATSNNGMHYDECDVYAELRQEKCKGFARLVTKYLQSVGDSLSTDKKDKSSNVLVDMPMQDDTEMVPGDEAALHERLGLPSDDEKTQQNTFVAITARYLAHVNGNCEELSLLTELGKKEHQGFSRIVTRYLSEMMAELGAKSPPPRGLVTRYLESLNVDAKKTRATPVAEEKMNRKMTEGIASQYIADVWPNSSFSDIAKELQKPERRAFSRFVANYLTAVSTDVAEAKFNTAGPNNRSGTIGKPSQRRASFVEESKSRNAKDDSDDNVDFILADEEEFDLGTLEIIIAKCLAETIGDCDEDAVLTTVRNRGREEKSILMMKYLNEVKNSIKRPKVSGPVESAAKNPDTSISDAARRYLKKYQSTGPATSSEDQKLYDKTFQAIACRYLAEANGIHSSRAITEMIQRTRTPELSHIVSAYLADVRSSTGESKGNGDESSQRLSKGGNNFLKNTSSEPDIRTYIAKPRKSDAGIAARYLSQVVVDGEEDDIFAELRKQESPRFLHDPVALQNQPPQEESDKAKRAQLSQYAPQTNPSASANEETENISSASDEHIDATEVFENAGLYLSKLRADWDRQQIVDTLERESEGGQSRSSFAKTVSNLLLGVNERTVRKVQKLSRASASRYLAAMRGVAQDSDTEDLMDEELPAESALVHAAVQILLEASGEGDEETLSAAMRKLGKEDSESFAQLITDYMDDMTALRAWNSKNSNRRASVESDFFEKIRAHGTDRRGVLSNDENLPAEEGTSASVKDANENLPKGSASQSIAQPIEARGSTGHVAVLQNKLFGTSSNVKDVAHRRDSFPEEKKTSEKAERLPTSSIAEHPEDPEGSSVVSYPQRQPDVDDDMNHGAADDAAPDNRQDNPYYSPKRSGIASSEFTHERSYYSPNRSGIARSEFTPERLRDFHHSVMERSALIGEGETEQTIIDTDETTSEASNSALSPKMLGGLLLSPTILTKRHRQAINAIEGRKWDQVTYLLSANPWLAEMPEITTNQYLLHKVSFFGAGDPENPPAPDQLCIDLVKMFPAVHKFDSDGNLPLHMASSAGNLQMVKILGDRFSSGASVRNEEGMLPLHLAIAFCAKHLDSNNSASACEVVRSLLLYFPAALAVADNAGNLPLHSAAASLKGEIAVDVINLLLDEADKQMKNPTGVRFHNKVKVKDGDSLSETTATAATDAISDVLDADADDLHSTMVINDAGETPLMSAIRRLADPESIEALAIGPGGRQAALMHDFNMNNALHLLLGQSNVNPAAVRSILKVAPETTMERNMDRMLPIEVSALLLNCADIVCWLRRFFLKLNHLHSHYRLHG